MLDIRKAVLSNIPLHLMRLSSMPLHLMPVRLTSASCRSVLTPVSVLAGPYRCHCVAHAFFKWALTSNGPRLRTGLDFGNLLGRTQNEAQRVLLVTSEMGQV
ncbi:unnamed protein product [Cochlearia groenlandica]